VSFYDLLFRVKGIEGFAVYVLYKFRLNLILKGWCGAVMGIHRIEE
jgi:hypothetical protein